MITSFRAARDRDEHDPLGEFRDRFVPAADPNLVAYLDGNSLGRPPRAIVDRLTELVTEGWGTRLIRSWSEGWLELPTQVGDQLAAAVLGAAPCQTVVADSTTVCLYKLLRAAAALRPDRREIVSDVRNFPTDRYLVQAVAAELGLTVRWIEPDPTAGATIEQVAQVLGERTAVVTLSHVAYRSSYLADLPAITALAHDAGALVVWDLSHSAGSVPLRLDEWDVDFAAGCTYKYLNAGPGAPAFLYVRRNHQDVFEQPIWGWMGHREPFLMTSSHQPAAGIRRALSGTPPIVGLIGVAEGAAMVADAGIDRIRAKAVELTELVTGRTDAWLLPHGVRLGSPRDPERRGAHVTITHPAAAALSERLIRAGVIIDFRAPDGIRIGLSPLTTSFAEVWRAMEIIRDVVADELG